MVCLQSSLCGNICNLLRSSENTTQTPLLAFTPLSNEEKLDTQSHDEFICVALAIYGESVSSLLVLVCDNEQYQKF